MPKSKAHNQFWAVIDENGQVRKVCLTNREARKVKRRTDRIWAVVLKSLYRD